VEGVQGIGGRECCKVEGEYSNEIHSVDSGLLRCIVCTLGMVGTVDRALSSSDGGQTSAVSHSRDGHGVAVTYFDEEVLLTHVGTVL
jgi:hypothetical protein